MDKVWVLTYSSTAYDGPEATILIFSTMEKAEDWTKKNLKPHAYHSIDESVIDGETFISTYPSY